MTPAQKKQLDAMLAEMEPEARADLAKLPAPIHVGRIISESQLRRVVQTIEMAKTAKMPRSVLVAVLAGLVNNIVALQYRCASLEASRVLATSKAPRRATRIPVPK